MSLVSWLATTRGKAKFPAGTNFDLWPAPFRRDRARRSGGNAATPDDRRTKDALPRRRHPLAAERADDLRRDYLAAQQHTAEIEPLGVVADEPSRSGTRHVFDRLLGRTEEHVPVYRP